MPSSPTLVIAGHLRRQFLLPYEGRPLIDVPGGTLLYAAAGALLWDVTVGLLTRVGEDYPHEWLRRFQKLSLDTEGINILPEAIETRSFMAYTNPNTFQRTNPVAHFARLGLPFPKTLLGYQSPADKQDSRVKQSPDSPKISDIPEKYLEARGVHLCPMDFISHSQLAAEFRQAGVTTITIDPGAGYMNGNYLDDLRSLLQGVTAFIPSEEQIRSLFWGRTDDLWEMAETLAGFGCEFIVIKRGGRGQLLFDSGTEKRWEIPAYPSGMVDPTGAGDSFCGGFLAGMAETYDPVRAVLHGNISSSLTIEGSGAFFALDTMPGLAQARINSLAELVRQI